MSKDELQSLVKDSEDRIKILEERMQDAAKRAASQQKTEEQKNQDGPTR